MKQTDTKEKALDNAIASVSMEGFDFNKMQRELCLDVLNSKLTLQECLKIINEKYRRI